MFPAIPPVTRTLIIACVGAYLAEMMLSGPIFSMLALWPIGTPAGVGAGVGFQPWQLVTYSFLHDPNSIWHLFFNMFALWMFGSDVERVFGPRRYATFWFASVVSAGLAQLAFAALMGAPPSPTVGASGGVFGVLLAFGVLFPDRIIVLLIPPIPMKAWVFVILYGLLELYLGVTGTQEGVAHFAHLGGMVGGWLTLQYWRRRMPPRGGR
ncbi:MAG: rhomboid family intramembrane serine protease [Burkholderiales bacterium]